MVLPAPWVHRAPFENVGSLWLLGGCSLGRRVYARSDGHEAIFHFLPILFLREKIDGAPTKKWRAIAISQKDPRSEFNAFGAALWGSVPKFDKKNPLDFERTALAIKEQIRTLDINVRVQFCSRGKAPYIEKIQPIKTALLTKGEWRAKFGDISWPAEAIEKFPEILRFGCQEGE